MVKPPVVHIAGLLRALGRGIDTDAWMWLIEPRGPAALLPAERRRLGRHALARHGDLPRALVDRRRTRSGRSALKNGDKATCPTDADELRRPRARRSGASPTLTGQTDARRSQRFARRALADAHARWKKRARTRR